MNWQRIGSNKSPQQGRPLWLYGKGLDPLHGECFALGMVDCVYGLLVDYGVSIEPTHWAYCDAPEPDQSAKEKN